MTWTKYEKHHLSECDYYQKKMTNYIYANILVYEHESRTTKYELDLQIPMEKSITGKTINVKSFTYYNLNFEKIEKDASDIITALTKEIWSKY